MRGGLVGHSTFFPLLPASENLEIARMTLTPVQAEDLASEFGSNRMGIEDGRQIMRCLIKVEAVPPTPLLGF